MVFVRIMYYFLGIERDKQQTQTVPQIRVVPPCVCRNLLGILLANLSLIPHNTSHPTDDDEIFHDRTVLAPSVAAA
jgi:hypothetical protein